MSEPRRTWPVSVLPISRGRNALRTRIMRRASARMSRRFSARRSPSCIRAMAWTASRISRLLGRSFGFGSPRKIRRAAFILARKYSDSSRAYISRAASQATRRRIFSLDIVAGCAETKPINAARGKEC